VGIGFRLYSYPGGLDSLDSSALRTNLVLFAVAIVVCVVALKLARKKSRPALPDRTKPTHTSVVIWFG